MAGKPSRSRSRSGWLRLGRGVDYVALGLIAIAAIALAALALSGVSLRSGTNPSPTSRPASTTFDLPAETPIPTPSATVEEPAVVSLLSNATVGEVDSWWALSIGREQVAGVVAGSVSTSRGGEGSIQDMQNSLAAAESLTGFVIVQAGSLEVRNGIAASEVASGIEALWQSVRDRGATPIASLLPPSDDDSAATVELNNLLASAASSKSIGVLDLHKSVATQTGAWATGLSGDGVNPNAEGSRALAQATAQQLPALVEKK